MQRAAEAKARLLRVARFDADGGGTGLALTFDAGLILVQPEKATGELEIAHADEGDDVPKHLDRKSVV